MSEYIWQWISGVALLLLAVQTYRLGRLREEADREGS